MKFVSYYRINKKNLQLIEYRVNSIIKQNQTLYLEFLSLIIYNQTFCLYGVAQTKREFRTLRISNIKNSNLSVIYIRNWDLII